jgi:hypothetical protein
MTPGFAGAEVDDDETGAAFDGRVSDVGDAFATSRYACSQVKADIVEVAVSGSD